jgi:hypothetical protein
MSKLLRWLPIALLGCALIVRLPLAAEEATPASNFVESVGVNIHLHYQDTAYADFPQVERALRDLGVHHLRDGLVLTQWQPYYDRLNALGRDGFKVDLIGAPGQPESELAAFPRRIPGVMEAIEGPNELDQSGVDWLMRLDAEMSALAPVAAHEKLLLVAPSLTQPNSFTMAVGITPSGTLGNLHNYWSGRNPGTAGWGDNGYGSYEYQLRLAHQAWPGKPLWTTETGYVMDPALPQGIPENIAARYTVRLLLEQYLHGIERTYLYELLDTEIPAQGVHDRYGLCRSDFEPKPAFIAVRSLLHMLDEPAGATIYRNLNLQLTGAPSTLHHMLINKRNGEFYLLLWLEQQGYDVDRKVELPVQNVRLQARWPGEREITVSRFEDDGTLNTLLTQHGTSVDLSVNDRVTVVRLR